MASVSETTAAVPASGSAPRRGWIVGGFALAAGLLMVALVLLGLLLGSAGGASGDRGSGGGSSGFAAALLDTVPDGDLTPNTIMDVQAPSGVSQHAYIVSYSDGASGDYFVAAMGNKSGADNALAEYFMNADRPLEGGTITHTARPNDWLIVEQGGTQCRYSAAQRRGMTVRTLTVLADACSTADAHLSAWLRAQGDL